ncbi:unnamed protein product [Protopolystoma xenopodis]|uniref:Uncharacterized protein n=1 Tax=Protopolystoma xenopodis TaxID=117903 RepID=A0A448WXV7_9PLAT|nr:unnamed protein product [Protopolystoma xenopodis]
MFSSAPARLVVSIAEEQIPQYLTCIKGILLPWSSTINATITFTDIHVFFTLLFRFALTHLNSESPPHLRASHLNANIIPTHRP